MSDDRVLGVGQHGRSDGGEPVAAGHTVRGFDPVPALKEAAEDKGAQVFDSGAEAVADADVVITSLPNGDIVKACYAEVLPAANAGRPVHRHLHDLGRRCPRRSTSRPPNGLRAARRAGVGRCQGRDRRHAGVHGRR